MIYVHPEYVILEVAKCSTHAFRYTLAQEHGDLVNLHDWFQSFKTVVANPIIKGKQRKGKQSPLPKKRKDANENENKNEATIQYPTLFLIFCMASLHLEFRLFFIRDG